MWESFRNAWRADIGLLGISVDDLDAIAQYQGVVFSPGDILIVRTGFVPWYESASDDDRARVFSSCTFTGVKQGEQTQRWLWNNRFSGVAGDAVSWEGRLKWRAALNSVLYDAPALSH